MLEIKNLHATVGGKEILKGINLTINAGEVHAIMGPNGSGKSTLSYVIAGKDGYEVTEGEVLYNGVDLIEMEPEIRAAEGVFLAFQYPVEIPGVPNATFLKEAVNAVRRHRGDDELDAKCDGKIGAKFGGNANLPAGLRDAISHFCIQLCYCFKLTCAFYSCKFSFMHSVLLLL